MSILEQLLNVEIILLENVTLLQMSAGGVMCRLCRKALKVLIALFATRHLKLETS